MPHGWQRTRTPASQYNPRRPRPFETPGGPGLFHDALTGDDADDTFLTDPGNDYLEGTEADDVLLGEDGNDQIDARDGSRESIDGGPGFDAAWIDRLFWCGFWNDDPIGVETVY